jgi:hypothetical protein
VSAKVVFRCDHDGCDVTFALDTVHHHCNDPTCKVVDSVPVDLAPVIRFLTDDPARGGKGWEFALDQTSVRPGVPDLLLVRKCFCPKHGDDIKAMPKYKPDGVAKQHARRRH